VYAAVTLLNLPAAVFCWYLRDWVSMSVSLTSFVLAMLFLLTRRPALQLTTMDDQQLSGNLLRWSRSTGSVAWVLNRVSGKQKRELLGFGGGPRPWLIMVHDWESVGDAYRET
jgi:hypothetical protein